ncbi:hypothetical protein EXE46_10695 [Halorubrum sp. GN11_10-6_MGM]|uniref:hypothetical protein n=1 Tax=Halorubrum sp. GN11_10-6_MGM TaxID=2518112 RepID=UPI0010F82AB4|nr:hypothetical protein [Halorubrum sp. GN11_10-6_MGM]TKX74090.1 hypothetical protein EXE46_10695 [Halorubrum sp. GN11_10-6_MGM]
MRFPNPSLSEYAINTVVVVLTLAVLQYTGWLSDDPSGLDPALLVVVAVTFPVFTYLLAVLAANVSWIPE